MKRLLILFALLCSATAYSQHGRHHDYTHADTLRGAITPERAWWDLLHYELHVQLFPDSHAISGNNLIRYKALEVGKEMQIDLQEPMRLTTASQAGVKCDIRRDGNAYFVTMPAIEKGKEYVLEVGYAGNPRTAVMAPWDGGFSWKKDKNGKHFIATSCQGLGASVWWPCKDHMYDEADFGMDIHAEVPADLTAVCNGRLKSSAKKKKTKVFHWQVVNPINNYGVNLNVGDYVSFGEKYKGEKGMLDMQYWVLKDDLDTAKVHFKDAVRTMEAFEHWFGPYPFYEDGYKLVQVPYLGMEHQSSVTYGNGFQNGYLGKDRSLSGWGMKFDFIIVHESGHEWFANNITNIDMADMWIHESFTSYSEAIFVEYFYGKEAGAEYQRGKRVNIQNQTAMIPAYNVNASPNGDIYCKGANMLHTLRQWVGNDEKWRAVLRGLNSEFYHQTVTTDQIEEYMASTLNLDLRAFFNQYLRSEKLPVLEYKITDRLYYRWTNCVPGFNMPVKVFLNDEEVLLTFEKRGKYQTKGLLKGKNTLRVHPDWYVGEMNILGRP